MYADGIATQMEIFLAAQQDPHVMGSAVKRPHSQYFTITSFPSNVLTHICEGNDSRGSFVLCNDHAMNPAF